MLEKKRARFMVEVDVDPIPGGFDDSRIADDLFRIIDGAVSHYHPTLERVDLDEKRVYKITNSSDPNKFIISTLYHRDFILLTLVSRNIAAFTIEEA